MSSTNLLGVPETRLPAEPTVVADLETLTTAEVVTAHPTSSLAWALLSDEAAARGAARLVETPALAAACALRPAAVV